MTDRAMSEETMIASLRDIYLPAEAAGGLSADVAVVVALACCAAWLMAAILRALSHKKVPATGRPGICQIAELARLSEQDRRVGLLHLLRRHAPERYADIRGAIYQPGGGVDIATLEEEVRRVV